MRKIVRFTRVVMVGVAVAAVITACGSSHPSADPSGSSSASVTSSSPAGAKRSFKGTVKVGVVADATGDLSVASDMQGALAYFDAVNAKGGVDGYKIVPTEYDTQSTPSLAVQAFRRAVAAKPAAILGGSDVAASALPALAQSGIPAVGDGFAPGWTGHRTLFPVGGDQVTHYSDVMLVVDRLYGHASKIALLGSSITLPDVRNLVAQASRAGVQLVMKDLQAPLVPTSAQLLSLAEQIKASGAEGVVALGVENLSQLQVDLNQLGAKTAAVANAIDGPATTKENGLLYSNTWAVAQVKNDPGIDAYVAAMKRYGYGKLVYSTAYGPIRWAQAALLVHALKQAGPPFSRDAVVKALSRLKNFTANGVVPKVSFPAFQKIGPHCQVVLKVVDGAWVSQKNGAYPFVCGGPSEPDPS